LSWKKPLLAVTIIFLLFLNPGIALSYSYEDFSNAPALNVFELSPSIRELTMKPDETQTVSLRFRNMTTQNYKFKIKTTSFIGARDKSSSWQPLPEPSWLHPELKSFRLKNNNAIRFTTDIVSPHNPRPGGHYELLFVSNVLNDKILKDGQAELREISRLGAIFYITVPGKMASHVTLDTFSTNKNYYSEGPVRFNVILRNEGNVHSKLNGNITVINRLTKRKVGEIELAKVMVLPDAEKKMTFNLPLKRPAGLFEAKLMAQDNRTGQMVTGKTNFYGLPWQLALWVTAVAIALLGVWSQLRKYRLVKLSDSEQVFNQPL
jgi:hypothetical protein